MRRFIVLFMLVGTTLLLIPRAVSGQGKLPLTPYDGNPILSPGETGAWDSYGIAYSRVIHSDGLFHMFYLGWTDTNQPDFTTAVGYATSKDGLKWAKYDGNPVFVPDKSLAPHGVFSPAVMLDGKTWVMYFNPYTQLHIATESVLRATAPAPTGPWKVEPEPMLKANSRMGWDAGQLVVGSVLRTDTEYVLYYAPTAVIYPDGVIAQSNGIGQAVSPDGIHWTKYNDPATTKDDLAASDPVFLRNPDLSAWDQVMVNLPVVRFSKDGWEMFYASPAPIVYVVGYATSNDGITWTRSGRTPILAFPNMYCGPHSVVVVDGTYYLYYSAEGTPSQPNSNAIHVATGTISRQ